MNFTSKAIPPSSMRYVTTGDWEWMPNGELKLSVAEYGNEDGQFLVLLHELVEAWLCKKAGVKEIDVSKFDIAHPDLEEPGDSPEAPYYHQHLVATQIERIACQAAGIDWNEHNDWVQRAGDEVMERIDDPSYPLQRDGGRFWAELHLFALRHTGGDASEWFNGWKASLPFNGCPCKEHFDEYLEQNPVDWNNFFGWTINLHNAVNERIGKPVMFVDDARNYWLEKFF